jgi:hypothetical protein
MTNFKHLWRCIAAVLTAAFLIGSLAIPVPALAANTGSIVGSVTNAATGAPVANVDVTAASPSQTARTTSDSHGFYILQALIPDTYTVSYQLTGYAPMVVPGVTVQQGQNTSQNVALTTALRTIAAVTSRAAGNLVQPNVTSDVYNVTGAQLNALSLGNDLHKTLYQYVQGVPGVTSTGFPAQPRIHGGNITDIGYEFDGIPIKERITGFFTTNLSNVGIANVEVYTGGLSAGDAANGLGIINTVVKSGTYPAFGKISFGTNMYGQNQQLTAEFGGATPNRRFSWYAAIDKTDQLNYYSSGLTYPAVLVEGLNGPGPVKTTDIVANFHYRPNSKDDIQVLFQNGIGDFIFNYLMARAPGEAPPVTAVPCPGYVPSTTTYTGATGGTAPNGQSCPEGLYFGTASNNNGNIWHHLSGIGKIQWNHLINDHSFFALRFAENFNQYIFDQPIVDANLPIENTPDFRVSANCPLEPYLPGTPVAAAGPGLGGRACLQQANWLSTGFYGDRRSNMFLASLDYTNAINANTTIKAGIGQELDTNLYKYYYTFFFNADGSYPANNFISNYPSHVPSAYIDVALRSNKWLVQPGLRYQRMYYDYPGGPLSVGLFNPTFSATYTMGPNDVIRGSYTDSTTFVGTGYVYRIVPGNALNGYTPTTPYNPSANGFSADPTRIHSADLQWEHQFDANTSLKFGPWMNKATNTFYLYRPQTSADGVLPITFGAQVPQNGGIRQAFGFELGINHVDPRPIGVSWWLSGTYDNYWTSITSSLASSYNVSPLPTPIVQRGNLIRSAFDPLYSGTLTADIHYNRYHFIPLIYYQGPSFSNIGVQTICTIGITTSASNCTNVQHGQIQAPQIGASETRTQGYWIMNTTALVHLGPTQDWTLGMQVTNLFSNTHDPTGECTATQLANTPSLGSGCGPFWPNSPALPSAASGSYRTYQDYSQTTPQFELFFVKKIP